MSRWSGKSSYSHRCARMGRDDYTISWVWDRYCSGSRLRFPQVTRRYTDEKGARRFCKKWDIEFPEEKK